MKVREIYIVNISHFIRQHKGYESNLFGKSSRGKITDKNSLN